MERPLPDRYIRFSPGQLNRRIAHAGRLTLLLREINRAMRIKITEPVFFFGEMRRVGEEMDVQVGPYRLEPVKGGLTRIPQFVEMPEEIKQVIQEAAAAPIAAQPMPPPVGSFAEATKAVLKPAPLPKPVSLTASLLTSLAGRRRKLEESIVTEAQAYAKELIEIETSVPSTFAKAKSSLSDRKASLSEIDTSLMDFAGANDIDPLQN